LTTRGKAESQERTKKRGRHIQTTNKPKVIRDYNDFMGGVDGSDQMLYQYLDDRKTLKFWKKVAFNIFGRMVLSSYLLYKMNTTKPMSRLQYIINIVEELSRDWLVLQEGRPNITDFTRITPARISRSDADSPRTAITFDLMEKIPGGREKNCCVCSKSSTQAGGKRKKSSYMCMKCKKGLHTKCLTQHTC